MKNLEAATEKYAEVLRQCKIKAATGQPAEWMYAVMREAEGCRTGSDEQRFKAMLLHKIVMDLALEAGCFGEDILAMGMRERIRKNQERLGIT